jgi:hypothetical protein
MGLYLLIEVDSVLSPPEFRERVVVPLGEALAREGLGQVLGNDPAHDSAGGARRGRPPRAVGYRPAGPTRQHANAL